jgi:FKBP-type peptidyl-prolyl cis-trans isomerase
MKLSSIFMAAGFAILAASCNSVDFKKTKGGMPYKLFASKNGKKVEIGKFVKMQVMQKVKDSVVFTSYTGLPIYFQVNPTPPNQTYDVAEIFTMLKEGDSVYAEQLMDTFIKRNPTITQQTKYRNGDKIITTVKVLKVFETAEAYQKDEADERTAFVKKEEVSIKDYLSKNKITNAQRTANGTYVQVLSEGTGAPVTSGKYVTAMYTGKTFGGTTFDSNMDAKFGHTEPLGFTVGAGQMIRGIDEGIQLLKEGSKAIIYIPSMLGYGPQPPSPDIKPFEHLMFNIEVLKVSDKAPPAPPMPMPQQNIDPNQQQQVPQQ